MRMGRNLRRSAGYVKMKAHVYRHTQKMIWEILVYEKGYNRHI